MTATLEGRIYYRLNVSIKRSEDRKKQKTASCAASLVCGLTDSQTPKVEAGFYLVVHHETSSSPSDNIRSTDEYLLSVPHQLLKKICDASRFGHVVRVSEYRLISLAPQNNNDSCGRKRTFEEISQLPSLLEIYNDGLTILASKEGEKSIPNLNDFMSLQQIFEHGSKAEKDNLEAKPESQRKSSKKRRRRSSPRYNLKATVDSISPIICIGEPFALMELYDKDSTEPYSCVVVFQGKDSLICHEGIFPGDEITIKQGKRQRWKIPEEVMQRKALRLKRRVSTHVFVLKDSTDIGWTYPDTKTLPVVPSTPVPLISLRGRVVSREWASRGSSAESKPNSYMIHSVEIEVMHERIPQDSKQATSPRTVLFLTYYPMAPSMTLSLRPGTIIQAVNIHFVGKTAGNDTTRKDGGRVTYYYGACLRSTVSILGMAPSPLGDDGNKKCLPVTRPTDLYEYYPPRPYAFLTVQKSYLEYACRKELYEWFHMTCNFPRCASSESPIPAFEELAKLWWEHYSRNTPGNDSRNPYTEFFDHACDEQDNVKVNDSDDRGDGQPTDSTVKSPPGGTNASVQQEGCHASILDSDKIHSNLPHWVSLSNLQQKCTVALKKRLRRAIQQEKSVAHPQVGWTASIDLATSELAQVICDHHDTKCRAGVKMNGEQIYTGGFLVKWSGGFVHHGFASASLADGTCILPATVSPGAYENGASEEYRKLSSAAFAFGPLDSVIVSCICLGVAPGLESQLAHTSNNYEEHEDSQRMGNAIDNPYKKRTSSRQDMFPMRRYNDDLENIMQQHSVQGACSLVQAEGYLFVISVQLKFGALIPSLPENAAKFAKVSGESQATIKTPNAEEQHSHGKHKPVFVTIQQCLDPKAASPIEKGCDLDYGCILGFLARQRFRLAKITDNRYRGCVLTLSHIPISQATGEEKGMLRDLSSLQSIEVRTVINYKGNAEKRDLLKKWMANLLPSKAVIGDDPAIIALAWWKIADDARSCALTAGGLDDSLSTGVTHETITEDTKLCVSVQLPFTAAVNEETRGYMRFMCSLGQLRATCIRVPVVRDSHSINKAPGSYALLDYTGGFKLLPGMLDRRPPRKLNRSADANHKLVQPYLSLPVIALGELMRMPDTQQCGIPQCSLGELLRFICMDMQNQQVAPIKNANLAPSLVRKIAGANFLGVSFCQAQAVCTKCFQSLCQSKVKKKQGVHGRKHKPVNSKAKGKDDSKFYWHEREQQPSFWHCPLPIPGNPSEGNTLVKATANTVHTEEMLGPEKGIAQTAKDNSNLRCPNGCSVTSYGEVKWECSGTLDDGKGQAKLYAERETAKVLLGMCQSTVDMIEEGVWKHEAGSVIYSKAVPPQPHIAKAVEGANFKYLAQRRFDSKQNKRGNRRAEHSDEKGVLHFLGPVDRAIYLMYQHCRHSRQVTRPLQFFVRCKPLADSIIHLNHTEIELVSPGPREGTPLSNNVATYSLPPLKLNLVDCCAAATSGTAVVEESWDLIQQLMHTKELDDD